MSAKRKLLVTGGGALNGYLMEKIEQHIHQEGLNIEVVKADSMLIQFKVILKSMYDNASLAH